MADGLTLSAEGLEELNAILSRLDLQTRIIGGEALFEAMQDVIEEAQSLAPYKTGALAGSGRVNRARVTAQGVSITLDFGVVPPLDYAVDQHENLLYNHPGGKIAKFLEIPLMQWVSDGGPEDVVDSIELYLDRSIR